MVGELSPSASAEEYKVGTTAITDQQLGIYLAATKTLNSRISEIPSNTQPTQKNPPQLGRNPCYPTRTQADPPNLQEWMRAKYELQQWENEQLLQRKVAPRPSSPSPDLAPPQKHHTAKHHKHHSGTLDKPPADLGKKKTKKREKKEKNEKAKEKEFDSLPKLQRTRSKDVTKGGHDRKKDKEGKAKVSKEGKKEKPERQVQPLVLPPGWDEQVFCTRLSIQLFPWLFSPLAILSPCPFLPSPTPEQRIYFLDRGYFSSPLVEKILLLGPAFVPAVRFQFSQAASSPS